MFFLHSENLYVIQPATNCYIRKQKTVHSDFRAHDCGLHILSTTPFIGASPDQIVECSCCGKGILEVKCPFTLADGAGDISLLPYIQDGHRTTKNGCSNNDSGPCWSWRVVNFVLHAGRKEQGKEKILFWREAENVEWPPETRTMELWQRIPLS